MAARRGQLDRPGPQQSVLSQDCSRLCTGDRGQCAWASPRGSDKTLYSRHLPAGTSGRVRIHQGPRPRTQSLRAFLLAPVGDFTSREHFSLVAVNLQSRFLSKWACEEMGQMQGTSVETGLCFIQEMKVIP